MYLYSTLLKELPELDDQIRMERDKVLAAYGCSSPILTGMPISSGPGDPCGDTVVNQVLQDWERYDALCQRYRAKQAIVMEVEQYLDTLDALELAVIKLRYFSRLSWPDVCNAEYISEATANRMQYAAGGKKLIAFESL